MTHFVIYIPGLGDSGVHLPKSFQGQAIKTWRFWGVTPLLFQVNWADQKSFDDKMRRLLTLIDECAEKGSVSLVCASAGATAALHAFALRPKVVRGVVCIAGKINNPQAISPAYQTHAPSFWESSQQIQAKVDTFEPEQLQRILSIRAMVDPIVPARDSKLRGAHNRVTWTSGHAITIGTQLLFGAPFFLRFLRQQPPADQV